MAQGHLAPPLPGMGRCPANRNSPNFSPDAGCGVGLAKAWSTVPISLGAHC